MTNLQINVTAYNKKNFTDILNELNVMLKENKDETTLEVITINFSKKFPTNLESIIQFIDKAKPDYDVFYQTPTRFTADVEVPTEVNEKFTVYNTMTDGYFNALETVKDLNDYQETVNEDDTIRIEIPKITEYTSINRELNDVVNQAMSYQSYVTYENYRTKVRADLDYNVDFQREQVWTNDLKENLIFSILQNKTLGAIYVHTFNIYEAQRENPELPLEYFADIDNILYDGKQRISTIVDFKRGLFPIHYNGVPVYYHQIKKQFTIALCRMTIPVNVTNFTDKADLIKFYVEINKYKVEHDLVDLEKALELI